MAAIVVGAVKATRGRTFMLGCQTRRSDTATSPLRASQPALWRRSPSWTASVRSPCFELPLTTLRDGELSVTQSHVVDIDGAFVGAAVRLPDGYRFVAVDVRLDELDGMVWPSLRELRQKVRQTALAVRGPMRRPTPPAP